MSVLAEREPEDKVSRFQAELVVKEQEALEVIKGDVCQWLSRVLSLNITPPSFMEVLDTGVPLCTLATAIQMSKTAVDEVGKQVDISIPMESIKCNNKAESGSFFARDNTANFITWCRKLGVDEAIIFESDGLVEHRDEKRVILCLLDVARYADKVGIAPPELVKMGREIDELPPSPSNTPEPEELPLSPEPPEQDQGDDTEGPQPKSLDQAEKGGPQSHEPPEQDQGDDDDEGPQTKRRRLDQAEKGQTEEAEEGALVKVVQGGALETEDDGSVLLQETSISQEKVRKPKKLSVDERVMIEMRACKCQEKMRVRNCGNGKFVVQRVGARKMTFYARMLSDRVMVRVGGGWDTLDHFLLKHDPCRILALPSSTALKRSSRNGSISAVRSSRSPKPPLPSSAAPKPPLPSCAAPTSPYQGRPLSKGILPQPRGKRPREI